VTCQPTQRGRGAAGPNRVDRLRANEPADGARIGQPAGLRNTQIKKPEQKSVAALMLKWNSKGDQAGRNTVVSSRFRRCEQAAGEASHTESEFRGQRAMKPSHGHAAIELTRRARGSPSRPQVANSLRGSVEKR